MTLRRSLRTIAKQAGLPVVPDSRRRAVFGLASFLAAAFLALAATPACAYTPDI